MVKCILSDLHLYSYARPCVHARVKSGIQEKTQNFRARRPTQRFFVPIALSRKESSQRMRALHSGDGIMVLCPNHEGTSETSDSTPTRETEMTKVLFVDNQTGQTDTVTVLNLHQATLIHHLKVDGCTVLAVTMVSK